jgi:hypothetical protein
VGQERPGFFAGTGEGKGGTLMGGQKGRGERREERGHGWWGVFHSEA